MPISYLADRRKERTREFGYEIKVWMKDRGISGVEFSAMVGCEQSMISRYISGERTPTYERAVDIAKAMYPDDEVAQERLVNKIGLTIYRHIIEDEDVKAFAEMLTRGNVPEEYKQAARAMARSLTRLTNGYR